MLEHDIDIKEVFMKKVLIAVLTAMLTLVILPIQSVSAAGATGWVDTASNTLVTGWARDPDCANPIRVDVYVNGSYVKSAAADLYRPDLGGAYAFSIPLALAGQLNKIEVYGIGIDSNCQLDGKNVLLNNNNPYIGGVERSFSGFVEGRTTTFDGRPLGGPTAAGAEVDARVNMFDWADDNDAFCNPKYYKDYRYFEIPYSAYLQTPGSASWSVTLVAICTK